jgi:hypothetical protein
VRFITLKLCFGHDSHRSVVKFRETQTRKQHIDLPPHLSPRLRVGIAQQQRTIGSRPQCKDIAARR